MIYQQLKHSKLSLYKNMNFNMQVLQVAEPKIHRNLAVRFLSTSTKIGTTQIPIFLYKLLTLTTDLQSLQPSKQLNQNQSISSKKSSQSSSITPNQRPFLRDELTEPEIALLTSDRRRRTIQVAKNKGLLEKVF